MSAQREQFDHSTVCGNAAQAGEFGLRRLDAAFQVNPCDFVKENTRHLRIVKSGVKPPQSIA
jgi:hypothetical protein